MKGGGARRLLCSSPVGDVLALSFDSPRCISSAELTYTVNMFLKLILLVLV